MKNKKVFLFGAAILAIVVFASVQSAASYIVIDPPGGGTVSLAWYSKPSDKTVNAGTSVSVTWKAKSSYSGKGYNIKKNGVIVKSGTWSSYSAITYSYTPTSPGTDELKCTVWDSQKTIYDYCYVTTIAPDADGDGVSDSREQYLGTDPNNPNDPLGQHFEDQSIGENPDGWEVTEFAGYSDVRIADANGLNLVNTYLGNILKLSQTQYGAAPEIYKIDTISLSSPLLISFDGGFYSQYDDWGDCGYLEVIADGYQLIKLEFKYDRVCIWESTTYCRNVDLSFEEKMMNKYNLILQNDAGGVDYSLYIDGACYSFGTIRSSSAIQAIMFGVNAYTPSEFYVDNIYCNTVELGNYVYNLPIQQAIPLCWVYAPEVQGVESEYHVGERTGVTIDLDLKVGIPLYKGIKLKAGINIASWYIDITKTYYGVKLGYGDPDVIMHIRFQYTIDKMSIKLPGTSEILMDVLINCNHIDSYYYDLSPADFETAYNWVPNNPRYNGITKIGSHTKTYEQDYGFQEEYYDDNALDLISCSIGLEVGFGLYIGVTATYSHEIEANTCLWVDRYLEPQFDYGRPNNHNAYLGIQPYIVKALGTM